MSRDKLLIVGVLVLGVLGFFVYQQGKKDQALGTTTTAAVSSADLPTISAPEDIDKVSIKNGSKDEIVLVRVAGSGGGDAGADKWELEKPVKAPASASIAKEIVTNLGTLKIKEPVDLKLDDDVKKAKKLDADNAIVVKAWKGADVKTEATFAATSSGIGTLTLLASKPNQVYAVTGFSSYLFTKEPKDFREKDIFKFDDANASSATIANKSGDYSFTKGDKGWGGTLKGAAIPSFDDSKVKDFLTAFKNLTADDFGDGKPESETGLDKPDATVKIVLKDNAGTYALKVGKAKDNGTRYAMKDGDSTIFVIPKAAADWAVAEPTKFAKAADAGAPDGGKTAAATAANANKK